MQIAFWKGRRRVDSLVDKRHVRPSVAGVRVFGRLVMRYAGELVVQTVGIHHYSDEKVECELGLVVSFSEPTDALLRGGVYVGHHVDLDGFLFAITLVDADCFNSERTCLRVMRRQ